MCADDSWFVWPIVIAQELGKILPGRLVLFGLALSRALPILRIDRCACVELDLMPLNYQHHDYPRRAPERPGRGQLFGTPHRARSALSTGRETRGRAILSNIASAPLPPD